MNNLSANYERILEVLTKTSNDNLLSYQRRVPKLKDLELISLALTAEFMGIESENHIFDYINVHIFTIKSNRFGYGNCDITPTVSKVMIFPLLSVRMMLSSSVNFKICPLLVWMAFMLLSDVP
ncbi:hypothetical protein SAMN05216273_10123 [Chryseobacterium taihuense]|uniref:Transposase n=1 Tax=Chryseobacterium taihuense TaxID=1141221 RepID=A0ABY0QNT4_9FLAO|nr:hypothetical protein SAMN05216273_10123 [Chryseobacterium taihuense]